MEPQIRSCISADGTSIGYATAGEGRPLIIVPGWGGSVENEWIHSRKRAFYDRLAQGRFLAQFDRRGVGLSRSYLGDLCFENQLMDLEAVLNDLGITQFDLFGFSDGSAIAVAFAAQHPERVSKLVLWASFSHGKDLGPAEETHSIVELINKNWRLATRAIADIVFPSGPSDLIRYTVNRLRQSVSPDDAAIYIHFLTDIDVRKYASQVKAPTVVLHRRGDRVCPLSAGKKMAALIPNARFIPLEGDIGDPDLGDISHVDTTIQFLDGLEVVAPEPETPSPTGMIGKTISHYRILEKLGEGGMGVIYKAQDTTLERSVALKFLSSQNLGTDEEKTRFLREAKAAAALAHPNICTVYEIDETEDQAFIAMEHVDGAILAKIIESGPLKIDEALDIAIQVADGLQESHEKGIIHRDIKAANIMVSKRGRAKILDFGLAKLAGKTRLTKTATIMGTVAYMSPEQAHGKSAIDHHTDIWSLGVLLYEMLAGRLPFDAPSDAGLIYMIIQEEPEPLRSIRPDIPVALEQVVKKTLQKDPKDRYDDMEALISDLKSIRSGAAPVIVIEEKAIPSIAVLPFADMSPNKDQEYFCDGISESIINELTQLSDLRVIARTSAFSFKGQNLDIREIGKRLDVGTVLEGSIQKAGNRVRVTAQLVNTARGEHLWSEKYDRELEDVFAIQDEISEEIVRKLMPRLLGEEKAQIPKRETVAFETYDLYLRGRYFWNQRTEAGLMKAIECFEAVIEEDPNYVPARTGLADSYSLLPFYSLVQPIEAYPRAREAAQKALEIDDTAAEAHTSMAVIKMLHDWDWQDAETEYRRAIELNPGYATAHLWYALYLLLVNRFEDAELENKRALELDPLSLAIKRQTGCAFYAARKFDQAMEFFRSIVEMDPNFSNIHLWLGLAYLQKLMYEEAIREFQREEEISKGRNPILQPFKGIAYAMMGREKDSRQELSNLLDRSDKGYVQASGIAILYFALGDMIQGFEWLEKACDDREPWLVWRLKFDLPIDNFRSDPRFKAVLRKMGLEKSTATVPIIEPSPSIAVLPFVNMSADPDQEYFCDGLSEEIINALTQLRDLKVIARTSAFSFRGKEVDVREIGKKLDVGAVLEGSVRKAGNRLRITAQLVDTAEGHHLWSERYDREMEDIFDIQDDITEAIVEKLTPKLLGIERTRLGKQHAVDLEAYNLYLKGRWFWSRQTKVETDKAVQCFRQAIEIDPCYAPAHAGLAGSYASLPANGLFPPNEAFPKAKQAALKALELDDNLARARSTLAHVRTVYDWDREGAEIDYKGLIKNSPGYANAHFLYGMNLMYSARFDEAMRQIELARELDPLSLLINRDLGLVLYHARKYENALEALKKTIEIDPNYTRTHAYFGMIYREKSMYEKAIAEFQKEKDLSGEHDQWTKNQIGIIYARMGRRDEAMGVLQDLLKQSKQVYVPPYFMADLYFCLEDDERGFVWLEKAYEEKDFFLTFVKVDPVFDRIRVDPRYIHLLKKIGLDK